MILCIPLSSGEQTTPSSLRLMGFVNRFYHLIIHLSILHGKYLGIMHAVCLLWLSFYTIAVLVMCGLWIPHPVWCVVCCYVRNWSHDVNNAGGYLFLKAITTTICSFVCFSLSGHNWQLFALPVKLTGVEIMSSNCYFAVKQSCRYSIKKWYKCSKSH